MAVNKVIYYGEVLVDMSQVSVKPEALVNGETALDSNGELITGQNPYEKEATDEEVATQADLLDQAILALQGKAAGGIIPAGAISIIENGTFDVTNFAQAIVNVEASGGALNGVSALTSGSITMSADQGSTYYIPHDLGQTPNFFILFAKEDVAQPTDYSGYVHVMFFLQKKYVSDGSTRNAFALTQYGSSTTTISTIQTNLSSTCTNTGLYVYLTTARKLKAGKTYCFVCGVIDAL